MNPETYYCPKCDNDDLIILDTWLMDVGGGSNETVIVEFICMDCYTVFEVTFNAIDKKITSERNDK